MDKFTYETKMEALEGEIRVHNVRGKEQDVLKASHDANTKMHNAKKAEVTSKIAAQGILTEQQKFIGATHDTKIAMFQNVPKAQDINQLTRENPLRQKTLDIKFEALQTDVSTARKLLDQRKAFLTQKNEM